jgi:hypothetical protein
VGKLETAFSHLPGSSILPPLLIFLVSDRQHGFTNLVLPFNTNTSCNTVDKNSQHQVTHSKAITS